MLAKRVTPASNIYTYFDEQSSERIKYSSSNLIRVSCVSRWLLFYNIFISETKKVSDFAVKVSDNKLHLIEGHLPRGAHVASDQKGNFDKIPNTYSLQ